VQVDYSVTGGTATSGTDYEAVSGTLTFAAGDPGPKTFLVTPLDDGDVEANETVTLALTNPSLTAELGSPAQTTVTIEEDDQMSVLSFDAATYTVAENGSPVTVTVNRTGGTGSVQVDYSVTGGTATSGTDYEAVSGTLTFAAGETSPKTFLVTPLDDGDVEANETVTLALTNPSLTAELGSPAQTTVTIEEDDQDSGGAGDARFISIVDDSIPDGSSTLGGWESWNWVTSNPAPVSGALAHQSSRTSRLRFHMFQNAGPAFPVQVGDALVTYVYMNPDAVPKEIAIAIGTTSGTTHRAYWGVELSRWAGMQKAGELPIAGQWVRLEVPAQALALEGREIDSIAFLVYGGQVTWDQTGVSTTHSAE